MKFVRYQDGSCALLDEHGVVQWSSDNDDEFLREFDAHIDSADIDDVIDYLMDAGYLDDEGEIDIEDEDDDGTATIEDEDDDSELDDVEQDQWQH
jgi:hypothetical protein